MTKTEAKQLISRLKSLRITDEELDDKFLGYYHNKDIWIAKNDRLDDCIEIIEDMITSED